MFWRRQAGRPDVGKTTPFYLYRTALSIVSVLARFPGILFFPRPLPPPYCCILRLIFSCCRVLGALNLTLFGHQKWRLIRLPDILWSPCLPLAFHFAYSPGGGKRETFSFAWHLSDQNCADLSRRLGFIKKLGFVEISFHF